MTSPGHRRIALFVILGLAACDESNATTGDDAGPASATDQSRLADLTGTGDQGSSMIGDDERMNASGDGAVDLVVPLSTDLAGPFAPDGALVPCGVIGAPCCAGGTCNGVACCVGGRCVDDGQACGSGLACVGGACAGCGGHGEPCCETANDDTTCVGSLCCSESRICVGNGEACGGGYTCTFTTCQKALVGGCGQQFCCVGDHGYFCTAPDKICDSNYHCYPCGDPGGPCCDGESCNGGGCCARIAGDYRCVPVGGSCPNGTCFADGSCGGCGALYQACCPGNVCTQERSVCDANLQECVPCGAPGEPCCAPDSYCTMGHLCVGTTCQ